MTRFGNGEKKIILTARHHACESTGNYIMEGVIDYLLQNPIKGFECVCIPFVDYDGVIEGDQGKGRNPHDHNRDYLKEPIYSEIRAICKYAESHNVVFGFDFHSPWHIGERNDKCFIVKKSFEKLSSLNTFGKIFEKCMTNDAFKYKHENDIDPNVDWNKVGSNTFGTFILNLPSSDIGFTLETAYFGEKDNVFSQTNAVATGRCFSKALILYISEVYNNLSVSTL